jgi:uncharacterized protein (TIRG00374 family)
MNLNFKMRWFRPVFSLTLICILIGFLDIKKCWSLITLAKPGYLTAGFLFYGASAFMEAARFYMAAKKIGKVLPYNTSLYFQFLALFYGAFLPGGQLSMEAVRGYHLIRLGISKTDMIAVIFFIKALGLYVLFGSILFGFFEDRPLPQLVPVFMAVGFIFILVTVMSVLFFRCTKQINSAEKVQNSFNPFIAKRFSNQFSINVLTVFQTFKESIIRQRKGVMLILILTCISFFTIIAGNYCFANALEMEISLISMTWMMGLAGVIQIIPISSSIFGTRDITFIYLLQQLMGFDLDKIGTFIIVINIGLLAMSIIGGIWKFWRVFIKKAGY